MAPAPLPAAEGDPEGGVFCFHHVTELHIRCHARYDNRASAGFFPHPQPLSDLLPRRSPITTVICSMCCSQSCLSRLRSERRAARPLHQEGCRTALPLHGRVALNLVKFRQTALLQPSGSGSSVTDRCAANVGGQHLPCTALGNDVSAGPAGRRPAEAWCSRAVLFAPPVPNVVHYRSVNHSSYPVNGSGIKLTSRGSVCQRVVFHFGSGK